MWEGGGIVVSGTCGSGSGRFTMWKIKRDGRMFLAQNAGGRWWDSHFKTTSAIDHENSIHHPDFSQIDAAAGYNRCVDRAPGPRTMNAEELAMASSWEPATSHKHVPPSPWQNHWDKHSHPKGTRRLLMQQAFWKQTS
jgi:hypothetical protein